MATNFGTKLKLLLTGFVWTKVTRQLVMKGFEWSSTECRYCRYPALIRDVAVATPFWLSMGYNFGCMIASDTLFDSRGGLIFGVKLSDEDVADFEVLRDVAMATIFGFLYMGCTLAPPEEYD